MRYNRFFCVLGFLCAAAALQAQSEGFSLGAGGNFAMNASKGVAGGGALNALWGFNRRISAGLDAGFTISDLFSTIELNGAFRFSFRAENTEEAIVRPFLQAGIGVSIINDTRDNVAKKAYGKFLISVGAGVQIPVFGTWYIEPSVRAGYPFILGAAVLFGTSFPPSAGREKSVTDGSEYDHYFNDDYFPQDGGSDYTPAPQQPPKSAPPAYAPPANRGNANANDDEEQYDTIN